MMNAITMLPIFEKGPSLVSKGVLIVAGVVGSFNFAATELLTQNTLLAIVLSAISMPAAAYFAARPKIIAAQAAREAAERTGNITEFKTIIEQMMAVHKAELEVKERQIELKEIEIGLLRVSKHNALKALQHAHIWIANCENGSKQHKFKPILVDEITGQEDAQTLKLVDAAATRVATEAAAKSMSATESIPTL